MYVAYCDGSYQDSIKAGGWASVIIKDNKVIKTLYQGYRNTSNNRQEIMAVINTLAYFKDPVEIIIYSDSQYVVNTINNKWAEKWFKDQDYSKKNLDLWAQLLELLESHKVVMRWVKGHANNEYNNLADMLCVHAARCLNIPEDEIHSAQIPKDCKPLVSST